MSPRILEKLGSWNASLAVLRCLRTLCIALRSVVTFHPKDHGPRISTVRQFSSDMHYTVGSITLVTFDLRAVNCVGLSKNILSCLEAISFCVFESRRWTSVRMSLHPNVKLDRLFLSSYPIGALYENLPVCFQF